MTPFFGQALASCKADCESSSGAMWLMSRGDCGELLPNLSDGLADHVITDPPYSEHVHSASRRADAVMGNGKPCYGRNNDLGFASLSPELRTLCAHEFARVARRWVLAFCDVEMAHEWRADLEAEGLDYVRTQAWIKEGCTPQFTGDRPAVGFEAIVTAHQKGRKRWNGGGRRGVYVHPVVQKRGAAVSERVHTTQKPIELMLELVELFTDAGETILDPFAGSGTTGVACLRLGRRGANGAVWRFAMTDLVRA